MSCFLWSEAQDSPGGAVARLGHYELRPDGSAVVWYYEYRYAANLRGTPSGVWVLGGQVLLPTPSSAPQFRGTWSQSGDALAVRIGSVTHVWRRVTADRWEQRGAAFNGFGYFADDLLGPPRLTPDDLGDYGGAQLVTAGGRWAGHLGAGLTCSAFDKAIPSVLTLVNGPVLGTLVLNRYPHSRLLVGTHVGHDFDGDGRLNDYGHTVAYYLVARRGSDGVLRYPFAVCAENSYQVQPAGNILAIAYMESY